MTSSRFQRWMGNRCIMKLASEWSRHMISYFNMFNFFHPPPIPLSLDQLIDVNQGHFFLLFKYVQRQSTSYVYIDELWPHIFKADYYWHLSFLIKKTPHKCRIIHVLPVYNNAKLLLMKEFVTRVFVDRSPGCSPTYMTISFNHNLWL